jgi:hypothetical protein
MPDATHPPLLRAFRHPLILASILALLLNDHLLKSAFPSPLTGKLSDFAGLFFFPFLLGVIFQESAQVFRRTRARSMPCLLAALLVSAALFAGLKTLPGVNAAVSALFERGLGLRLQAALDPTDLLALCMVWPAARLWQRIERNAAMALPRQSPLPRQDPLPHPPDRLAYLGIGLAALAALATAPCPPEHPVQRLVSYQGSLYTGNAAWFYRTCDGRLWHSLGSPGPVIAEQLAQPVKLPKMLCDANAPAHCYRIDGSPRVEESADGGSTWQITWQIPAGRESYMRRAASHFILISRCSQKEPDLRTFDLAFLAVDGVNQAVVAMGNEGILLRDESGVWQRLSFAYQSGDIPTMWEENNPSPFAARDWKEANQSILPEYFTCLLLGSILALALLLWTWEYTAGHATVSGTRISYAEGRGKVRQANRPLWGVLLYAAGIVFLFFVNLFPLSQPLRSFFWSLAVALCWGLPFVVVGLLLVCWRRASRLIARPRRYWLALGNLLLSGVVLAAAPPLVFLPWAFGVIPYYGAALALAAGYGLLILVLLLLGYRRLLRFVHE